MDGKINGFQSYVAGVMEMKVGLNAFGTTYMMGLRPQSGRPRITAREFMLQAVEAELQGVEMPIALLEGEDMASLAHYAEEHDLYVVIASSGYDPNKLQAAIDAAALIGAKTIRTVVGGADFGGDRRKMVGKWQSFMQEVLSGLAKAAKAAEEKGIHLGVENHQDVASEELIWLCEQIHSPYFGIVLDAANPLATAEEPVDFAKRILPHIKHVHLKDYWIYLSEVGYRLVRCPIGQGVVDFPALFKLFSEHCPDMTMAIEIGALEARHTRVLADDFWPEYPVRSAAQLAKTMRFVHSHARLVGDWLTPYEKGDSADNIVAYENHQLQVSIAYMKGLVQSYNNRRNEK
jgi:sugar phosphate isomerase/epimerase